MADLKISQLTGATTPLAGTEVLPIVQSGSTKKVATDDLTVKNLRSNATTGILQVAGPGAAATRTMTVPDANFTAARTDAAQTFTGNQTFNDAIIIDTDRFNNIGTAQTVTITDYTGGTITITTMQPGIGFSTWVIPFAKRAGTIAIGTPSKAISSADPVLSVTTSGGNIVITPIAANTYIVASLQYTPFGA